MGRVFAFLLAFLAAFPAQAAWREATTRHFRIYSEGKEEALTAYAAKVERFDAMLRLRFGVADPDGSPRLTIFMLPSNEAVAKLAGQGKFVAGFYHADARGSMAVTHREKSDGKFDLGADSVLFHEYAHHFMYQNFNGAFPAWFTEGFAEYVSTAEFTREGYPEIGKPPYYRAYGLLTSTPIPVSELLAARRFTGSGEKVDAYYGRSWLLTHYLYADPSRSKQMASYLKSVSGGMDSVAAATAAFGDLKALDAAVKSYLNKSKIGYFRQMTPINPSAAPVIRLLPAGEGAVVMSKLAVMAGLDKEDAVKVVAGLAEIVARTPSAEGWRLLAEAQLAAGQEAEADSAADEALKLDPALSRAMMVKANVAIARYVKADTATATMAKDMRSWVVKANRADPNDPIPLAAFYRLFRLQGQTPPQIAFDGLVRAYSLAPEASDLRFNLADALAYRQKWDDAIRLMETLANDPHNAGEGNSAQQMLDRLKKAKAGDKEALESLM